MTRFSTASALAAVLGGALLLATPMAHAQSADQPTMTTPKAAQHAKFSDQDLHHFIAAAKQVQAISVQWQQKLKKVDDKQKSKKLRMQATKQIRKAVRDEGLTVQKYNRISIAARQDKDLHKKLVAYLHQSQQ